MARMSGFVFQDEYLERLAKLSDQEVGRMVRALAEYHATGKEPELTGRESVAFDFIRVDVDKADKAYQQRCRNMARNNEEQLTANDSNCTKLTANAPKCAQNKNKNINIDTTTTTTRAREEETPFGTVIIDPLIVKVQRELNGLTDTHYQRLEDFRQTLGDELVDYAIDAAVGSGVRNWNYVEAILNRFEKDGVRTVGEAKAQAEKRKEEKPHRSGKVLNAQKFDQRDYSEEQMRSTSESDIYAAILKAREGTA